MDDLNDLSLDRWGVPLYTPVPDADAIGTLNYRPVTSTLWRKKPGRLHHPVKPIRWFIENFGRRQGLIEAFRAQPVCQSAAANVDYEQEEREKRPNGSAGRDGATVGR
jgi:hypothetical protein